MTQPLDGIRILDLTHVLAGPHATGQLALMGADVIRVEHPGGIDFVRWMGGSEEMRKLGLSSAFLSQNAGKRSVALDMKTDEGHGIVLDLAATADVVVENYRPGVIERLGLGYDAIRAQRGDVIYASLSGFGPVGPLARRPAYDHIIQGMSGLMAMTGDEVSGPMRSGLPIIDHVAGQAMVVAILGALLQRARVPGEAQRLHVSMLDAVTNFMGSAAIAYQATGQLRGLEGNKAASASPYSGRFDTSDGCIVVTANTEAQARALCGALGRPELFDETDEDRRGAVLREVFATDTGEGWEARLEAVSVPCGRVMTIADVMAHPQTATSPSWVEMAVPELDRSFLVPALSFRAPWQPDRLPPPPTLGRDTDAVLSEMGRGPDEIARLRAAGVIGGSDG